MALDYDTLFSCDPFDLASEQKQDLYQHWLSELTEYHQGLCPPYRQLVQSLGKNPLVPVRLFKEYDLKSIATDEVKKTMTSSGTTGQTVSKIYLDKETSARQSKALSRIVSSFVGKQRLPMLIIDSDTVVRDRTLFSARGAGILGFSMLGRDVEYALDENMDLNLSTITRFCNDHQGQKVLLFGFTYMIWQHFCEALLNVGLKLDLSGYMIHGGGWKKLADLAIDSDQFKQTVEKVCGIDAIYNYYGMIEQTGSIAMECAYGHLHASIFSDIEILDPCTLLPLSMGRGVIKSISLLPTSYPGHILLTEDEGEILGEDDCLCGRKGKYFTVYGRLPGAEIRGCSDTYDRNS